jgi:hypothetical protein
MEVSAVFGYNGGMDYKKQAHAVYYTRYHIVVGWIFCVNSWYNRRNYKEIY